MRAIFGKKKKNKKRGVTESSQSAPPVSGPVASTSTNANPLGPNPLVNRSRATDEAIEIAEQIFGVAKDISEATGVLDPLKSACALMIRGTQSVRASRANQSDWAQLCEDLEAQRIQMEGHRDELQKTPEIDDNECLKALEHYLNVIANVIEIASTRGSGSEKGLLFRNATLAQMEKEGISRQRERVENAWQTYSTAIHNLIKLKAESITNQIEGHDAYTDVTPLTQNQDDYGMTGSDFTIAYGDRVDLCEEGTRVEIMESVRKWEGDSASHSQIFWLKDAAGTGKSTIAATMAREWSLTNRLAGRFFFSPNSRTTQTTKEFCRLVAEDVARNQPSVADLIQDAMKAMSSERNVWFDVQLQRLIIEPIMKLEGDRNVFLVVDALDNCELSEERSALLNAIIRHLPSAPRLKILLTSRPIQDIVDILSISSLVHGSDIQLLNIRDSHHPDVALFVERKLKHISSDDRAMIIARSGGLFLYAATVCRMLERSRNRLDVLKIVSEVGVTDKLEHRMDILYLSVLKQALVDRGAGDMMLSVLAMIIVAYQPLSSNTIRQFLPKNNYVEDFVQDLGGVLKDGHPDRPIKVLHPTFREFILSNEDRANGFLLHPRQSALEMANACISTLEYTLEDDIFHLRRPGRLSRRNGNVENMDQLINKRTSAADRYASAFWAHHAAASEMSSSLWSKVLDFLASKLLNWVELMSWRGGVDLCIEGLSRLRREALNQVPNGLSTQSIVAVRHAHQFIVNHQSFIVESALQTYSMALFFTPAHSPIFQSYRERYRLLLPKIVTSSVTEWEEQMILSGHSEPVSRLVFSPDGSRLISIGFDGVLQLWNTETGALVGKPFRGLEDPPGMFKPQIRYCSFSKDGQRFAFFSCPNELHIRYSTNGEPVIPHWEWGLFDLFSFSATMTSVLVVKDSAIGYRIVQSGQETQWTGVVDETSVDYCAISPNGQTGVLMGSIALEYACTVLLWDLRTQHQITSYRLSGSFGYRYDVQSNASFSPDSTRFAIWSSDSALLCDGQNGDQIEDFGRIQLIDDLLGVLFCPRSRYLAYWTLDFTTIAIREIKSGKETLTIKGGKGRILHLSFSPDGNRLACVHSDQTVRVWSVEGGDALDTIFSGYTGKIDMGQLSANWNQFASSTDDQIRLYNLQAGAMGLAVPEPREAGRKRRLLHPILGVAHLGSCIAIRGQSENGVELWDTVDGTSKGCIAHEDYAVSVAFSPDGQLIAVLHTTAFISIWNATTLQRKELLTKFPLPQGEAGGVLFSPDSSLLSVYHTGHAFLWTMQTMKMSWWHRTVQMRIDLDPVNVLAFSHDSERLVAVDSGDQLYVTNTRNQQLFQTTMRQYYGGVSAAFSLTDSSLLALVTPKLKRVTLWRVGEELEMIMEIPLPYDSFIRPSFCSDGRYLACGPLCWDITSLPPEKYTGNAPPDSFSITGLKAHSFLYYKDGWICSGFPDTPLLPLPAEFRTLDLARSWHSFGERVIFMSRMGEPILVDCSPLLAEARMD